MKEEIESAEMLEKAFDGELSDPFDILGKLVKKFDGNSQYWPLFKRTFWVLTIRVRDEFKLDLFKKMLVPGSEVMSLVDECKSFEDAWKILNSHIKVEIPLEKSLDQFLSELTIDFEELMGFSRPNLREKAEPSETDEFKKGIPYSNFGVHTMRMKIPRRNFNHHTFVCALVYKYGTNWSKICTSLGRVNHQKLREAANCLNIIPSSSPGPKTLTLARFVLCVPQIDVVIREKVLAPVGYPLNELPWPFRSLSIGSLLLVEAQDDLAAVKTAIYANYLFFVEKWNKRRSNNPNWLYEDDAEKLILENAILNVQFTLMTKLVSQKFKKEFKEKHLVEMAPLLNDFASKLDKVCDEFHHEHVQFY